MPSSSSSVVHHATPSKKIGGGPSASSSIRKPRSSSSSSASIAVKRAVATPAAAKKRVLRSSAGRRAPHGCSFACASNIGSRPYMEDRIRIMDFRDCCMLGVFDGHGGSVVAHKCAELVIPGIRAKARASLAAPGPTTAKKDDAVLSSMREAFLEVDATFDPKGATRDVGSTALVAVVTKDKVYIANCGDCRALLVAKSRTRALTWDHTPADPRERRRVERCGGKVLFRSGTERVDGILAVTRSIGDKSLPSVTAEPNVTKLDREGKPAVLILASDGFWGVMTNRETGVAVRSAVAGWEQARQTIKKSLDEWVVAALLKMALARKTENVSVVVVTLYGAADKSVFSWT
jgi:protein phosphatase 2C